MGEGTVALLLQPPVLEGNAHLRGPGDDLGSPGGFFCGVVVVSWWSPGGPPSRRGGLSLQGDLGWHNMEALMIRIVLWVYYSVVITRNPTRDGI